jgi:TolB-like protein
MAGEIFICYRRSDQDKARLLHALLKQRGVDAWYDVLVGAGEDWRRTTARALDAAPIFVLLFSKDASESDDIGKELAAATFSKKMVVPVRIENIKPAGEFLYELASRNWFDAFEDTEARFEVLADRLAALVKGGPNANIAAFSVEAQPVPQIKAAARPLFKRPLVLGGLAATVLALAAAVAVFGLRPQASQTPAAPASQLIAFFGFTPAGNDPAIKATAEAATDRMFQSMGSSWLETVARTETKGTPEDRRFARAAELGARYALGGEVRSDGGGMTLTVRFEDVQSRRTMWEQSFSNSAPDIATLPGQAVRQTAQVMWCIIKTRSELTRDTDEILNLIADRCREGAGSNGRNASYVVARMRAVAEADPDSAYNQAQLVMMLGLGVPFAPPPTQAAWIAEAEAALQRATKLDPKEAGIDLARITLAEAKGVPVGEWDTIILEALAHAEGKDNFVFGQANGYRYIVLRAVGRFRDALPHQVAAVANDPLQSPWVLGFIRAMLGQTAEARAEIEPALTAYGALVWGAAIPHAIFLDAADAEAMLKSPPSTIPQPTVDCLRDIHKAFVSKDSRARALGSAKARACTDAGTVSPLAALASLAALNDLDAAFTLAGKQSFNPTTARTGTFQVLFWPTSRAMRADPRFLPLVEKVGLMGYWRATRSQPDICETETAPFCAALKVAMKP